MLAVRSGDMRKNQETVYFQQKNRSIRTLNFRWFIAKAIFGSLGQMISGIIVSEIETRFIMRNGLTNIRSICTVT